MAGLAVFPFGKTIVRAKDLRDGTQAVTSFQLFSGGSEPRDQASV